MHEYNIRTANHRVNVTASGFNIDPTGDVYLKNGTETVAYFPAVAIEGFTVREVGG